MDLLVKLYDLTADAVLDARLAAADITLRPVLPPELHVVRDWIVAQFGQGWASEATVAICRQPVGCQIAVRGRQLLGFACHDATARGFFGPTGVLDSERGQGIGRALLIKVLLAMRAEGYGYAVIGGAGPVAFYRHAVGAIPIEGSAPGLYAGLLTSGT